MVANNLLDQIQIRGFVEGWANITIDKWRKELRRQDIGITDELYDSFTKEVKRKGTEIAEIVLKFKMYGRFRDMGVGNGLKAYERGGNNADSAAARRYGARVETSSRRGKRWINKIKTSQSLRLAEILGERASRAVVDNFNNTNNVTIRING